MSSTDYFLEMELDHLRKVFTEINGFPLWFVNNAIKNFKKEDVEEQREESTEEQLPEDEQPEDKKMLMLKLPYRGKKGESIMKSFKKQLETALPNTTSRIVFTGIRLSSHFNLKDEIPKEHKHNVVYMACLLYTSDAADE